MPNTQDSFNVDFTDEKMMNSRVSFSSRMGRKDLDETVIVNKKEEEKIHKYEHNPLVLYIILGLVVLVLAVII